jgi:hypothetical protein
MLLDMGVEQNKKNKQIHRNTETFHTSEREQIYASVKYNTSV